MKYINKREIFLKEYNSIGLGDRVELIKEDSGPFANDILWGDSLLGRLINSTIRKVVIANNLRKMDSVENRLIYAMDQLAGDSTIEELPEEDKQTYNKALIFSFLRKLQKAVEDDEPLQDLKDLTNTCISHVEDKEDIEDKEDLLNQLKEWKKFLYSIEEEKEEVQTQVQEPQEEGTKLTYDLCLDNFKAVYDILIAYEKVKDQKGVSVEVGKEYLYNGKVVKVISVKNVKTIGDDKKWMTNDDGTGKTVGQPGAFAISRSSDGKYLPQLGFKVSPDKLEPLNEEVDIPVEGGVWKEKQKNKVIPVKNTEPIKPVVNKTASILTSIKPVYDYFMTEPDILKDMDIYFKYKKEGKTTKDSIFKIYNYIRKINENLDNFLTRPEKIGEKLSGLYKVTKTKPDGSFDGIDEDMKKGIAAFNNSMSKILVSKVKTNNDEKVEETPKNDDIDFDNKNRSTYEDRLMKFSSFMKVYEADTFETPPVEPPAPKPGDNQPQTDVETEAQPVKEGPKSAIKNIQEWWHNNMKIDKWLIDDTEKEEINKDLSTKLKNTRKLTIPDIDYVIEICKIFNNAYRLHTTQVIPSGRKGGKVSNMTFREYTTFGNGTPENAGVSGGPYRNNKLFQHWYEKVMDVLKDRKYQPIFNIGTRIKMGDDYIEKAGAFLAKFMRDMLDGDGFFKEGQNQQGAQVKFLDKYFGYKGDDKLDYSADNVKTTPTTEKSGGKFTFVKRVLPYENLRELTGSFFAIDKDGTPRYFYVNDVKDNYVYVKFSDSFIYFKEKMFNNATVTLDGGSIELDKESEKNRKPYLLKSTKIKFTDLVQNSGTINKTSFSDTKYITEPEGTEKNYGNWSFKNIYTLIELKDNTQTTKYQVRAKSTKKYTDMVNDSRLKDVEFK